jgi:hypothetical protein
LAHGWQGVRDHPAEGWQLAGQATAQSAAGRAVEAAGQDAATVIAIVREAGPQALDRLSCPGPRWRLTGIDVSPIEVPGGSIEHPGLLVIAMSSHLG